MPTARTPDKGRALGGSGSGSLVPIFSILLALIACGVVLLLSGENPIEVYRAMLRVVNDPAHRAKNSRVARGRHKQ